MSQINDIQLVGAIDVGTTYSGWAFASSGDFDKDPANPHVQNWKCGPQTYEKTPTCILVNPGGTSAAAFGYDAENKYIQLAKQGEHEDYFYFSKFKMALNRKLGEKLGRDLTIEDERQRSLPALDVFAMSIKYLAEDMITVINKQHSSVTIDNVVVVMTVPTLWTDAAKRFMREAAIKAGLNWKKIVLALEPEVASIFCQFLSGSRTVDGEFMQFPLGTRYLVVDAGGGTVDIAVHEVEGDYNVKEVSTSSGRGWGGIMIDDAFETFLKQLFGAEMYGKFKEEHIEDWVIFMRDFEHMKTSYDNVHQLAIQLPVSFQQLAEETFKNGLKEHVRSSKFAGGATAVKDKLTLKSSLFRSFYEELVGKIISLIKHQLEALNVGKVKAILMVGGLSASKILQSAVKSYFAPLRVMVPKRSSASVLRGAIIYGHHPMSITERVLKYTYGVEVFRKFKPGLHPENKRVQTETGNQCKHIFSKHVEREQTVKVGEAQVEQRYTPSDSQKTSATLKLFASTEKNPQYTDICTCIGVVQIDLDEHDGDLNRGLWVSYTFSGLEIVVYVYDEKTGNTKKAKIDFLGPSLT